MWCKRTPWLLLLPLLPPPYSRSWGRTGHTDTQGVLHFRARRRCLFTVRTNPWMGLIPSKSTGICLFTGDSNPCQLRKGYTSRSTTGPLIPGITTGNHIPCPSSWRGALKIPVLGDNAGFIATRPIWALQTVWLPSQDSGAVSRCHTLPATHEWFHHSLTTEEGWSAL